MTFTKLPKAISAEELLSTPLPPVKWIIPGLLPAGLACLLAPVKLAKVGWPCGCVYRLRREIPFGIEK